MYYYQRVRDIREDKEKTQGDIAEVLKITRQQYQLYESGERELPMHHFITLARYYNISLDYLAGLTDKPRTLDGKPYNVKNMTQINGNNNKINIKNS